MCVCIHHGSLCKEAFLKRKEKPGNGVFHEYKHKYVESSLVLGQMNQPTVACKGLRPHQFGFDQIYSTRHDFSLIEQPSNTVREKLVTL